MKRSQFLNCLRFKQRRKESSKLLKVTSTIEKAPSGPMLSTRVTKLSVASREESSLEVRNRE